MSDTVTIGRLDELIYMDEECQLHLERSGSKRTDVKDRITALRDYRRLREPKCSHSRQFGSGMTITADGKVTSGTITCQDCGEVIFNKQVQP